MFLVSLGVKKNIFELIQREGPNRKRLFGKPRCRWEKTIQAHLTEIKYKDVLTGFVSFRIDQWWGFVNMVMNLRAP
jgi:hypothetical protein